LHFKATNDDRLTLIDFEGYLDLSVAPNDAGIDLRSAIALPVVEYANASHVSSEFTRIEALDPLELADANPTEGAQNDGLTSARPSRNAALDPIIWERGITLDLDTPNDWESVARGRLDLRGHR
jgi:hypothetical protein